MQSKIAMFFKSEVWALFLLKLLYTAFLSVFLAGIALIIMAQKGMTAPVFAYGLCVSIVPLMLLLSVLGIAKTERLLRKTAQERSTARLEAVTS